MSGSDLYDTDALLWAERQAALLERLAAGERVDDRIDWPEVIEEIRDVGLSALHDCERCLREGMGLLLKLYASPASEPPSRSRDQWREDVGTCLDEAYIYFSPSMRTRINLADLYATALRSVRAIVSADDPLPADCPFNLDALLAGDIDALLALI